MAQRFAECHGVDARHKAGHDDPLAPRPLAAHSGQFNRRSALAPRYAGNTTTFVFTGVRSYRSIMSCVSKPVQPLVRLVPIVSGSLVL